MASNYAKIKGYGIKPFTKTQLSQLREVCSYLSLDSLSNGIEKYIQHGRIEAIESELPHELMRSRASYNKFGYAQSYIKTVILGVRAYDSNQRRVASDHLASSQLMYIRFQESIK